MMVSIHGPDDSEFDFRTAMNIWEKLRKRHILVEKWNVDVNVSILSKKVFAHINFIELRIGTKSVFEFHNYRSVLFHGI
jgi:hypothetical protein